MGVGRRVAGVVILIIVIAVVLLLVFSPAFQNFVFHTLFSPFAKKIPANATFELQRTIEVNANGGTIVSFAIDQPLPTNITDNGQPQQTVYNVTYSPPYSSDGPRYGFPWAVWNGGTLSGQQSVAVAITYDVRADARVWNIDASSSLNTSAVPLSVRNAYLGDEWQIIVTDPQIRAQSASIVGSEKNVFSVLNLINVWVTTNIAYPQVAETGLPQSSLGTLASRVGDCDDQAILFSALARAAGVPAWLQLGALYNSPEQAWGAHGWVQAYIPTVGGGASLVTIDTVNRDFLVWEPNRFADYTDDGNGSHLQDYYYQVYYNYEPYTYSPGHLPTSSDSLLALSYVKSTETITLDLQWIVCQPETLALAVRPT
jgi:hypothetical protein